MSNCSTKAPAPVIKYKLPEFDSAFLLECPGEPAILQSGKPADILETNRLNGLAAKECRERHNGLVKAYHDKKRALENAE